MRPRIKYKKAIFHLFFIISGFLIFVSVLVSCKKYLDLKPDKKLTTPTTVQTLQGILDNYTYLNTSSSEAGEIAADNYYLTESGYLALRDRMRDAYLWKPGLFTGMSRNSNDWVFEYNIVYNSNLVLDNIDNVQRNSINGFAWDNCKGSALLFRGKAFYEIAQIWTLAYDSSTANNDLGIPLRLTSDFNEKSLRANIQDTYSQIITDLKSSIPLLPNNSTHPFRPSKAAAYGLLARTYLTIGDYNTAKLYADSTLSIKKDLLDFNILNANEAFPFSGIQFTNPEDIMHSWCIVTNWNIDMWDGVVDTTLYQSYMDADLRKTIYFDLNADGTHFFRGSYSGENGNYNGIAVDEIYFIRAECFARQGNIPASMYDLNMVMAKRWKAGTPFVPFTTSTAQGALNVVLIERRKELFNRMLRFTDIKRLNKKGANIIQKRIIQGQTYILPSNDPRYALPIPDDVIEHTGIQQN